MHQTLVKHIIEVWRLNVNIIDDCVIVHSCEFTKFRVMPNHDIKRSGVADSTIQCSIHRFWSLLWKYDHHPKIMPYNVVKKMAQSATPDLNVCFKLVIMFTSCFMHRWATFHVCYGFFVWPLRYLSDCLWASSMPWVNNANWRIDSTISLKSPVCISISASLVQSSLQVCQCTKCFSHSIIQCNAKQTLAYEEAITHLPMLKHFLLAEQEPHRYIQLRLVFLLII